MLSKKKEKNVSLEQVECPWANYLISLSFDKSRLSMRFQLQTFMFLSVKFRKLHEFMH